MKESKSCEIKEQITNTFLKTVSAFANFSGGQIIFGIKDDGTIIGIDDPDTACLDVENKINDSISPKPDYQLSIDHKNKTITCTVLEGRFKPYLYKGKAYRRSDTATIEVDNIEYKRLTLEGMNLYYEQLSCKKDELTFSKLEEKLIEKLGISKLTDDMLRTFGFYTKEDGYNIAAWLFADTNELSGIDIARFGNNISEILDRETLSGKSILSQFDGAVEMFRRYYQYEKIEGIDRIKVDIIPEEAFREALANAIVHRTWDVLSNIRISMFADRIEISSPGGLPNGLTKEEYLSGNISSIRNPILANMFFRMHYIEMFGTGIRRINDSYSQFISKPDYKVYDNSIVITLPIITNNYRVTTEEMKVMEVFNANKIYSTLEIAEKLSWSKDKTIRLLNKLVDRGYIVINGNRRSTKYSLK